MDSLIHALHVFMQLFLFKQTNNGRQYESESSPQLKQKQEVRICHGVGWWWIFFAWWVCFNSILLLEEE
jgi:hypothetical protein